MTHAAIIPIHRYSLHSEHAVQGEGVRTTLGPVVTRYVGDRLRLGEITPITARNIRNHLLDFAQLHGDRPLERLGPRSVERWIESMHHRALAPSTQALRLSSLRTFARWCVRQRIVRTDWTTEAPKVTRPRQVPHDMTNEHVSRVLAACENPRDKAIVWLMFGCGLRCVEVSRLNVDDWDQVSQDLFVVGKGRNERRVPVPVPTARALTRYLAWSGHGSGPMIRRLDDTHGRLGPERISGRVGILTKRAGVRVRRFDGRGAHGIRAAAASDLYEACEDPLVVQEFLGHASLATGAIYLRRAKLSKVRRAQEQRPWGVPCTLAS